MCRVYILTMYRWHLSCRHVWVSNTCLIFMCLCIILKFKRNFHFRDFFKMRLFTLQKFITEPFLFTFKFQILVKECNNWQIFHFHMAVNQNIQERRMCSRSKIANKMGEGRRIRKWLDSSLFLPQCSSLWLTSWYYSLNSIVPFSYLTRRNSTWERTKSKVQKDGIMQAHKNLS